MKDDFKLADEITAMIAAKIADKQSECKHAVGPAEQIGIMETIDTLAGLLLEVTQHVREERNATIHRIRAAMNYGEAVNEIYSSGEDR